ncbi:hypothetical protein EUX98_g1327 [Antrodiella citrinella]|uniref:Xylanolytic transcriptional activator regulatory domain-containing protein n=1 Tax=Antrodiella citrinella TaxID=2447956 RepID=A0A4S4N1R1_9APHY|nr:hypothetical protein EUX98_g1327 [Antrodiella citrinella]
MSERIRQLEDALAILQSSVSREAHPLLRRDLLDIKSGLTLHSAPNLRQSLEARSEDTQEEETTYVDAFGTLAVRDDGAATFYGRSAGTESLLLGEKSDPNELHEPVGPAAPLPPNLQRLTAAFPTQPSTLGDVDMAELMESYLPPWPRAANLCDLYLEQSQWFFGPMTRRQLIEEVLPLFYPEAESAASSGSPPAASDYSDPSAAPLSSSVAAFDLPESGSNAAKKNYTAHDLALIFVVFCFGALTDPILPPAPYNVEAEQYYQLTRAAMNIEPVVDRPPSVVTVQTLSLMAIYQGLVADENSIESTWALMGLSTRLAQSVGLHRDCARWKLSPQEVQKRRALFWELFITDCWQSLATGRLACFSLPFVDTELPGDPDQLLAEDGTALPSFPLWKAKFGKEIVSQVVNATLTVKPPRYSVILDLDRKIRDFEMPKFTKEALPVNGGLNLVMSHYMPKNYREFIMLYVHRGYFAMALDDFPTDPLRSQYAPSFLAGYRSACNLLSEMRDQFAKFPTQIARFWVLWTHAFSAVIMLGSVVTHGATTKTSQAALAELRLAVDLFERAAIQGGRAVKFLPAVRRLHEKAEAIFKTGVERKTIFSTKEEEPDELSIFTGRTRTVVTKANKPAPGNKRSVSRIRKTSSHVPSSAMPSPPESAARASESPSASAADSPGTDGGSPAAAPAYARSLESYGNQVHPMLVDQLKEFEGQLDAQITSAQQHYTGMVAASNSQSEARSAITPTASTNSAPMLAYPSPPESVPSQSVGYQSPPQHLQPPPQPQVQSYDHAQSSWDTWSQSPPDTRSMHSFPSMSVPSGVSTHAYETHPPHQHVPAIHYQPPPQPAILPSGHQTYHEQHLPMFGAVEGNPTAPTGLNTEIPYHPQYAPQQQQHTPVDNAPFYHSPNSIPQQQDWAMAVPVSHPHHGQMAPDGGAAEYAYPYDQAYASHPPEHQQYASHVQEQAPIPMSRSSSLLPPGNAYSLAETWTTFMQQELPAPGTDPRQHQHQHQHRR